jgi:hypothetical protein
VGNSYKLLKAYNLRVNDQFGSCLVKGRGEEKERGEVEYRPGTRQERVLDTKNTADLQLARISVVKATYPFSLGRGG